MSLKQVFFSFFILGLSITSPIIQAKDTSSMSIDDIRACMRVNVYDRGSLRNFQIKAVDTEGKSSTVKVKLFWKPAKNNNDVRITLQVIQPETLAGTAYLLTRSAEKEQLYLYLSAIRRVKSVVGSQMTQKIFGSDFTFADIKQVQGLILDGHVERLADQEIAGRPVYVLETETSKEQTGYRMVRSYVDHQSCVLFKTELFSDGETPHKVMEADVSTLLEIDPWWLILSYKMTDHLAGTHTDLALSEYYIHERLPESLFTPEGFYLNRK